MKADTRQPPPGLHAAITDLPCAHGGAPVCARVRVQPDDFRVSELPLVEPCGEGEHVWLRIRKTAMNTADVAAWLAQAAGVPLRGIGYAGLKDRHAVTEQWYSVHLPGSDEPDWQALAPANVMLLRRARHSRKLRRGALRGNAFCLRLREVSGDIDELRSRLEQVAKQGVPNYFGVQRFGRGGSNLAGAARLFAGTAGRLSRHRRGLALSAARAFLFNQVLARRVAGGSWNRLLPGEAAQLAGSHSFFLVETLDEELERRLVQRDIHPTGPLAGRGEPPVAGECRRLEAACLQARADWLAGLGEAGLKQERRALRVFPGDFIASWPQADELSLEFTLPAGSFATSVLRELVHDGA